MYERMLNKQIVPSFDDLLNYSSDCADLWRELDKWLKNEYSIQTQIRFPYGNKYGWSVKYSYKSKHICDVFAEKDAFTAFFRISNDAMEKIFNQLNEYTKSLWENKYSCGEGGWLHFRILTNENLCDLKKIIQAKINVYIK